MSRAGITGMQAAAEDLLTMTDDLADAQWRQSSAALGWSVKDVVSHIGCLLALLQSAVHGEPLPDSGIEALNDLQVAAREDWSPDRVLDDLHTQLDSAIPIFTSLQDEPLASVHTPMLDLGSYPLHAIADMFAFDITTHLRYDILAPRGPVTATPPPLDEQRLAPAVDWLLGGIPQMQPGLVDHLTAPLHLVLTGPAAQRAALLRRDDRIIVERRIDGRPHPAATITSTSGDFLAWSTTRRRWRDCVTITGDHQSAVDFLDALNLI